MHVSPSAPWPVHVCVADGQFPVEVEAVEKDHDFLDKEDIQSLFRWEHRHIVVLGHTPGGRGT